MPTFVVASDKLFFWLFQNQPDRILQLQSYLPALILEAQMATAKDPTAPPLLKALALLLQPERELPATTALLRAQVKGTAQAAEIDDFTQSVAYREIYGLGRQAGELDLALRLLQRRCGVLSVQQEARIRELPLPQLEALGEALLDFQGSGDLNVWLAAPA